MPIPKNTLTLRVYEPDNVTLVEGAWRIWLETEHGLAINDAGNGIGGSQTVTTSSGVAAVDLPDTTNAGFDPTGAYYKAAFASTDRRTRVKSEPFHMDTDKSFADIVTPVVGQVTSSLAAQAIAASVAAALAAVGDTTGDPTWYRPESDPPPDGWTGTWWVLSEDGSNFIDLRRAS